MTEVRPPRSERQPCGLIHADGQRPPTCTCPFTCNGRSAHGDCGAPAVWELIRTAGPGRTKSYGACGRHLSWVARYITVPDQKITLRRLT